MKYVAILLKGRCSTELIETHALLGLLNGALLDTELITEKKERPLLQTFTQKKIIRIVFLTFYYYPTDNLDANGQF